MRKLALSVAVTAALAAPSAFAQTPAAPASPWSFNVGVTSDYLFRGISQTHGRPAIQAGIDYLHGSGFYVGAWASSITWVKDWTGSGSVEIDVYGGIKNSFGGGNWNYDVGYIAYNYPGKGSSIPFTLANPNTQELYGAIGYKFLTVKYSHATSSHFIGWYGGAGLNEKTRGSGYLELNANYDAGGGWTLIGHVGRQKVNRSVATGGFTDANYTDWKIGVSKDIGFGTITAAYSDTNTSGACPPVGAINNAYCWGNSGVVPAISGPTAGFKDVSKGKFLLSFLKTF